jgi:spore coat polysaccharide biosynthesis protein SpsF
MGGSDPAGLTVRAARALVRLNTSFRARFIIGPGMNEDVAQQIAAIDARFEPVIGLPDLSSEYTAADVALCAFGVTAYELAAHGIPALYLCLTDDHARSASAFERAGMGLSLGLHDCVEDDEVADSVHELLADTAQRQAMHAAGLMTLDGEGANRVAADLRRLLEERRQTARSAA